MDTSYSDYETASDGTFDNSNSAGLARKQTNAAAEPASPAKPLSAYAFFFQDTVQAIKRENPNCTFQEIAQVVSTMWTSLEETQKQDYEKRHEHAKNEYVKQMRIYRRQKMEQSSVQEQSAAGNMPAGTALQSKPAVFMIPRQNVVELDAPEVQANSANDMAQQQQQVNGNSFQGGGNMHASRDEYQADGAHAGTGTADAGVDNTADLVAETEEVQKCLRDNCNQPAIINPDWEDEYCSNECVVIHCRNVFNAWVLEQQAMGATTTTTTAKID